jgi:anaerobic selenocysteine-containing dehydrogenase
MERPNAVFVWSMGLTQHVNGVETIKALSTGSPWAAGTSEPGACANPGPFGCQGGAEVGCLPQSMRSRPRAGDVWGSVPRAGWTTAEMIDRLRRDVDVFWIVGGNFLETLPDHDRSRAALKAPKLRVHHDILLSSSMLVESDGDVLLLPATTRYESPGGGTETSTERRIIFSPEIPGRRIGSAKPEWWVFRDVAGSSRRRHRLVRRRADSSGNRARRNLQRHRRSGPRAIKCNGAVGRCSPTDSRHA